MKRILGLALVAVAVVGAAVMPRPAAPAGPDFTGAAPQPSLVGERGSVWYCTWADSGDLHDSDYALVSLPNTAGTLTLPSAIPSEEPHSTAFTISGPGSTVFEIETIVRSGAAPGLAEFDDGPAAVAAMVTSDTSLAGDRCTVALNKVWYLPGGTTREGRTLTLRLFNPFPELAKASVEGRSEFGAVVLPEVSSVDVAGRSWVDVIMNTSNPFLDDLVLIVTTNEGNVLPSVLLAADGGDEATWPGSGLSTSWDFPVVAIGRLRPELVVTNPGTAPVTVDLDVFSTSAATPAAVSVEVAADTPTRIALDDLADGAFGIHLAASAPVAAVIVAADPPPVEPEEDPTRPDRPQDEPAPARIAGTIGAREPSTRWLLPGAGTAEDATTVISLLNTNPDVVTVTLQALGSQQVGPEKVQVEPGRVLRFRVPKGAGISGYLIEATAPITTAWSSQATRGVAFVAGVAVSGTAEEG
ncbi:MAG TPA: DUF5719 family protein [Acidimicrobiia bacterium]